MALKTLYGLGRLIWPYGLLCWRHGLIWPYGLLFGLMASYIAFGPLIWPYGLLYGGLIRPLRPCKNNEIASKTPPISVMIFRGHPPLEPLKGVLICITLRYLSLCPPPGL